MTRTAEHSIQGYVYQFLRYLCEILKADASDTVTIEGIEDVDVNSPHLTRVIQCKYHSSSDGYTLGKIYKPILLMLEHFGNNPAVTPPVEYHLFCHFPGASGDLALTPADIEIVLSTGDKSLRKIVDRIPSNVDRAGFLSKLRIEFGPSLKALEDEAVTLLASITSSPEDAREVFFPAAFQRIVDTSTRGSVGERTVSPEAFVKWLRSVKQVTFTRWTRELTSRDQIARRLKRDLQTNLNLNTRRRLFVIDPRGIDDFQDRIISFLSAFVAKYSSKQLHEHPPLFVFSDAVDADDLKLRLYDQEVTFTDGLLTASEFRTEHLFRDPIVQKRPLRREFSLRIAKVSQIGSLSSWRPDDMFLVNAELPPWKVKDINVHRLQVDRVSQLEFLMQLRASYD